uniref:Major facilitator superfamily (MFS) profile domain-containing protein n=1 Tax=Glossina morsitans morsitans TaxID=37546 RepID=A0A1B0FP17_GLOMM
MHLTDHGEDSQLNTLRKSKAQEFGDLMQALLERKGKFQIILIILLSLNSMLIGINHTITTFHAYVPKFYCRDHINYTCGYFVNGTECPSGYHFDENDDTTLAVEFSTVCRRAMLAPLINSLYFVGVTLGSIVCSSMSDVYGRRKLVIASLYGQAIMALAQYVSTHLMLFIVFRLMQGFFIQGLQTVSYALIMEYSPSRFRTVAATYWESNWAIGLGILGAVAYFVRDWRMLTLVLTLPVFLTLSYVWYIPESIVWLSTKGRCTEATRIIHKIAKFNRNDEVVQQCNSLMLNEKDQPADTASGGNDSNAPQQKITIGLLMKNKILRKHLLSMICVWFSVTLSYYGILYFLPNLAGSRHLNWEYGALIELLSYIMSYFIFAGFGRRLPMAFLQYCNGGLILFMAILSALPAGSYSQWWIVATALTAKGLAVSSFCGMFIFGSELLPTACRGLGLGLCGCSARTGSLLAPQLMALIGILPTFVPLSIMSGLLVLAATITLFLPETLSTILPNTIEEANQTWGSPEI